MNKAISIKLERNAQEKAQRLSNARVKLLDGTIGAISIDTCIFTAAGYRLEHGNIKRLEQFKGNSFKLIFSEITLREIRRHLINHIEEANQKLASALRGRAKYWDISKDDLEATKMHLLGTESAQQIVNKRLQSFGERTGLELAHAKDLLSIPELLKRYFSVRAPFEQSETKKSEFPDAITLLSLEAWAKKQKIAVLFVTKDKGCLSFCSESELLYGIDDLGEALALIQERDSHQAKLSDAIAKLISTGSYPEFPKKIETAVENDIWSIDWLIDAESSFYFDPEFEDINILHVAIPDELELHAVDFQEDMLVVQTTIGINFEATASFTFSVKDWVDKDMVPIGDATVIREHSAEIDILITFLNPSSVMPEIGAIEVVPARKAIDFGSVGPDYSDEDPYAEKY